METQIACDFHENDFLTVCNLRPQTSQFELTQSFKKVCLEGSSGFEGINV